MCIAIIGGMDRLKPHYREEAARAGIDLKVFNSSETYLAAKLKNIDALLIFTNKVSHRVRKEALKAVKDRPIPVLQHHSCGVCTLRECLNCLVNPEGGSFKCPRK